jgi:hypothetical protein
MLPIREIRTRDVADFLYDLPAHLSGKTKGNIVGLLHKILNDAFKLEDISRCQISRQSQSRNLRFTGWIVRLRLKC